MAKGQLRSNKETKKPKKDKAAVPVGTLMGTQKAAPPQKQKR